MRRGSWHQCGDRSQKLVIEELQADAGVGVILSPRDLGFEHAVEYARTYHDLGAEVLIDTQFYIPEFNNDRLMSYPIGEYRLSIERLSEIDEEQQEEFVAALIEINRRIESDAIVAPAVLYEAGRQDIVEINQLLFRLAKQAADELGLPVYSTVAMGRSVTSSEETIAPVLDSNTVLPCDGWYYVFEFDNCRIPSSCDEIYRCLTSGLTLCCTGKPVLHAYAGPLGLLSFGFGATATGIGHNQKLWQFKRERWEPSPGPTGWGTGPSRYFSKALWGTIVDPDEVVQLSADLRAEIMEETPFYVQGNPWSAGKHLVYVICTALAEIANDNDPRTCARAANRLLQRAVSLHGRIIGSGIQLKDKTNIYQGNWISVIDDLLQNNEEDYNWLRISEPYNLL